MRPPLELKKTLNLPKTDFSMKANLPQNEPKWLERWEKMEIYAKIRESRRARPVTSYMTDLLTRMAPSMRAMLSTNA